MATPHVSGAAAVVWSAFPSASDDTIEDYLKKYATDLGASGYDTTYGYGLVNTHRSITQTP